MLRELGEDLLFDLRILDFCDLFGVGELLANLVLCFIAYIHFLKVVVQFSNILLVLLGGLA